MRVPAKVLLSFCLIVFLCAAASAQNLGHWKQSAKLAASDGASGDLFGASIAVSGNTLVVGAPDEESETGAVYVFVKTGNRGTQVAKLTASDGMPQDEFGTSVSINGNIVVVGVPDHTVGGNQYQGIAYVFVEPPGGWTNMTETAELTASDGAADDGFGSGVGISGKTIVAGAPGATVGSNKLQGAVYAFVQPENGWQNMTQTAKLTASDQGQDALGYSVAISANTVVAGAFGANDGHGAAYVFVEPTNGWVNMSQTAELTAKISTDGFQDVAIAGNTIVAGAPFTPGPGTLKGEAAVYVRPKTGWKSTSAPNAVLTASNAADGDELGSSVSVSGNVVIAGAPYADSEAGAAYIFVEPADGWANMTETSEIKASDEKSGDGFGGSVANIGTTVLAGAPGNDGQGAVYAFVYVSK